MIILPISYIPLYVHFLYPFNYKMKLNTEIYFILSIQQNEWIWYRENVEFCTTLDFVS